MFIKTATNFSSNPLVILQNEKMTRDDDSMLASYKHSLTLMTH